MASIKNASARTLLIGGTSHAGKSSLALSLAARLGYSLVSTDKLARHPGRPWPTPRGAVPAHVREHYGTLSTEALFSDVMHHYHNNVRPRVLGLIHQHEILGQGLVIEGSALWPEWWQPTATLAGFWLAAPDDTIAERIRLNAGYTSMSSKDAYLVDRFVERSLYYQANMLKVVPPGCLLETQADSTDALTERILEKWAGLEPS